MNVLFICSQNQLRSPTAEAVFKNYPGVETRSAGTAIDAEKSVTREMIEWADLIFAMENLHYKLLKDQFGELMETREVIILRIRDEFLYMDPKLVESLKEKVTPYLERICQR
jgi:predicted protein tyrosine phosphatase